MNVINFYSTKEEYGFFSNFARYSIELEGKKWPTSEHYYQAKKFEGTELEEKVRLAATPGDAAAIGRDSNNPMRSDWEEAKYDVMRVALRAKFTQHKDIQEKFLATGDAKLVEHTVNDNCWGDGGDGSGKNMLGVLLMELREQLRKEQNAVPDEKNS